MILGINADVRYRGKVYHIQTEDSGVKNPVLFTHIFVGGSIIGTRKISYEDALDREDLEDYVRELMRQQHHAMEQALLAGEFDVANRLKAHADIPLAKKRGAGIGIHSRGPRSTEPRSFEPRSQPAEPVASEPTPAPSAAAPSAPTTPTPTLMRRPTLPKGRATGSSTRPLDLSGLKQQPQRRATASLSLLSPPTTPSKERTRLDPGDDVGDMSLLGSEDMLFMMDGVLSPSSIPSEDDDNAIHLTDPSPTQFVPFPTPYRTGHAIDPLLLSYFIEVSKPSFE